MKGNAWASKIGFILAAAGSAIGLGAIWKFPYTTGTNGGGAFLLLFLAFTLLLGLPVLIAEFLIGRTSGKTALRAFSELGHKKYTFIGWLGVIACFLLLSFYSVIGGWVLIYIVLGFSGNLTSMNGSDLGELFATVSGSPGYAITGQLIFLIITCVIVLRGVQAGIEKMSKIMMPLLFLCFIVLVVRSLTLEGAGAGVRFFIEPDFSALNRTSVLSALGQAFFSLSLGVSAMLTYASYMKERGQINRSAIWIVSLNVVVSLLAGFAIFPAVFASGLDPAEGPSLLFIVLPTVFSQIQFGSLFLILFFLLFAFASITSSIAMLEVVVSAITDRKETATFRDKKRNTIIATILIGVIGIPSALSFGMASDITWMDKTVFDWMDFTVSNLLMPIGALLISFFAGFKLDRALVEQELVTSPLMKWLLPFWRFSICYLSPLAILIILIWPLFGS
ncbi:sodium-dependent transporter [Exiguobacterium sp. K1]|uniref:sodium-dependent transporter n=1 Tax=Exiguobacterium sp. K1 TaxID=2980105 RepID=UPI00299D36DB|nr:sodium-dependent transporter [Exiguobacterium sp. K1]MDX1258711.1 sodium-dependent transporter [Exiguobacterium sp. K1]